VTFGSAYITNTNGNGFSVVNGGDHCSGLTIAAGATCTIIVNFNAGGGAVKNGTLSVPDSGSGSPQVLSLTGT
jgi:hypothetical protein